MTRYAVSAQRTTFHARSWETTTQLPTFYLDSDVQGIISVDSAERVAYDILRATPTTVYQVTVVEVPTGTLPDWLCPVLVREGQNGDAARHSPHSRRPWECRHCRAHAPEGTSWHFNAEGVQL